MGTISIGSQTITIAGTLQGFKDYLATRVGTTASSIVTAGSAVQKKLLASAAQWAKRLENNPTAKWSGDVTTPGQAYPWPRDGATCNGAAVTNGTTPGDIVTGEYEIAIALHEDPDALSALTSGTLVKSAKAGSAEVEFFGPSRGSEDDTPMPAAAWPYWGCYLEGRTITITVTGNTTESSFESKADLSRGLP